MALSSFRPRSREGLGALLGLIAILSACGARTSPLLDSTGAGGESGEAGSGGGQAGGGQAGNGQAGGGQAGEAAFQCPGLALDGAPRPIGAEAKPLHQQTFLTALAGAPDKVVVGVLEIPEPSTGALSLRLGSLAAWGAWPAQIGAGTLALDQFDFGRLLLAPGVSAGTVALLATTTVSIPDGPGASGLRVASAVLPDKPATAWTELEKDSVPERPLALVRAADVMFAIDESRTQNSPTSHLRSVASGNTALLDLPLGCGAAHVEGALAASGSKAWVAYSSIHESCPTNTVTQKPAGDLLLARVEVAGANVTFAGASAPLVSEQDRIGFVRVAAHPKGVWVVYQYEGIDALVPSPYMALSLDLNGKPLKPAWLVLGPGASIAPPAVSVIGDRLVLSYAAVAASQEKGVNVAIWDPQGNATDHYSIDAQEGSFIGDTSLLVSPNNQSMLVSWLESSPQRTQAYVARISCFFP